jgi:hypothetical protein
MQEFMFGIIFGIIMGRVRKTKTKCDIGVQADEVKIPKTSSITIPKYIPQLINFWGPDSG